MNELKTLGDLTGPEDGGEYIECMINAKQLKQSAINDIKVEYEKWGKVVKSSKVDYIKWKFDITEEDLKTKSRGYKNEDK